MQRSLVIGALALLLAPCAAHAVNVDIQIAIPPPPQVVFHTEPEVIVVPQTRVEYVPVVTEYDMYRYGKYWYVNHDGYWYRSRSFKGPYKFVSHRHLPHEVVMLPAEYRHHPTHPRKAHKHKHKHKKHQHHDDD